MQSTLASVTCQEQSSYHSIHFIIQVSIAQVWSTVPYVSRHLSEHMIPVKDAQLEYRCVFQLEHLSDSPSSWL